MEPSMDWKNPDSPRSPQHRALDAEIVQLDQELTRVRKETRKRAWLWSVLSLVVTVPLCGYAAIAGPLPAVVGIVAPYALAVCIWVCLAADYDRAVNAAQPRIQRINNRRHILNYQGEIEYYDQIVEAAENASPPPAT